MLPESNPNTTVSSPSEGNLAAQATESRQFSQKIESLALNPKHRGAFFTEDATTKDLALVTAKYKDIKVYWLVDPQSDLIYDAKFFSYGGPISMAMGEMLCSLVRGMKLDTACDVSIEEIEILLRDAPETAATLQPRESAFANLPMLLATAKESYPAAKALALASIQLKQQQADQKLVRKTPFQALTEADQAWKQKSKEEQITAIEAVLTSDIRPGLNMDGGDLQIVDLDDSSKLTVKYQGACGSCGSSVGATLSFIEDTLRRQVYGGMQVVPVELPDTFSYMSPPG
ncbi:MAG TPA: iron-sulfur cluster assembly scaffold protein SufE [Fibrobacteres bacterium]|jgi:NifU-like protein|nr:iron-sulfur cluster assembly scaffold protein SufE [Fibrobacterota bacterium]